METVPIPGGTLVEKAFPRVDYADAYRTPAVGTAPELARRMLAGRSRMAVASSAFAMRWCARLASGLLTAAAAWSGSRRGRARGRSSARGQRRGGPLRRGRPPPGLPRLPAGPRSPGDAEHGR